MLPRSFQQQNLYKKTQLEKQLKLYTIIYDYELRKYYASYIRESYYKWGNVVDYLGLMKLTGYNKKEIISNFNQLMQFYYIDSHKLSNYEIIEVKEELIGDKFIT